MELKKFIDEHSKYKDYLIRLYKKEVEEKNNKIQDKIKNFVPEKNDVIKYIFKFLEPHNPCLIHQHSNFNIEQIKSSRKLKDKRDLKLLSSSVAADEMNDCRQTKIFRVVPTKRYMEEKRTRSIESGDNLNVLLLHEPDAEDLCLILNEGFFKCNKGKLGNVTWLKDSYEHDSAYPSCYYDECSTIKRVKYLLVSKVSERNLRTFNEETSEKMVYEAHENEHTKTDSNNNKIIKGTFIVPSNERTTYIARPDLVKPAYLIEIKSEISFRDFINEILYSILRLKRFRVVKTALPYKKFTETELKDHLENELALNLTAELSFIEEKFRYKMRSTLQQIDFNIDQIKQNMNDNYTIKALTDKEDDYRFILQSTSSSASRFKHIFKVNPTNKNKDGKVQGRRLYLHGVKSNKIQDVLKYGYSDEWLNLDSVCKEDCIDCREPECIRYATDHFHLELHKSNRFFIKRYLKLLTKNDRKLGISDLAYVFVVAEKQTYQTTDTGIIYKDSRDCYVENGCFVTAYDDCWTEENVKPCKETVPMYLLVVKRS